MSDLNKIEAQIAEDRHNLTSTLDQLTDTLAPDHIATKLSSSVESYGGELGRQAITAAKQNPAAFALVAAGIGLLLTGTGTTRERAATTGNRANSPEAAMDGFDERVAAADAAMKSSMATESAAPSSSWLRENLEMGLEALPAPARRRVIKARKAAIEAQKKVEAKAKHVARTTSDYHGQHPLTSGALAFGVGALMAAVLPSTRREDVLLGEHRDAMMADAHTVLAAELAKLKGAVRDGVKTAANSLDGQDAATGATR